MAIDTAILIPIAVIATGLVDWILPDNHCLVFGFDAVADYATLAAALICCVLFLEAMLSRVRSDRLVCISI